MSSAECSLKNRTCHRGMEWGATHHHFWMSPSGSVRYLALSGNGWAGRRLGLGGQSPLLCDVPSTQPGYCIRYPERLREVAPEPGAAFWTRRQSSNLSLLFDSDLWTEAGDGYRVVPIPDPCARLITNLTRQYRRSFYIDKGSCGPT